MMLAGVLHSFKTLESGKHEVRYVIGMDEDDHPTLDAAWMWDMVPCIARQRPITLGEAWNALVGGSWDACCVLADKHLCLTPGWDDHVATIVSRGIPLCRWTLLRAPEETVLIMSRKWYDVTGRIFPEWFPFWFSERWVDEVHQLAFGTSIPMVRELIMTEPTLRTSGLRDLEFWFGFFARTRIERIKEARIVCQYFDRPMPDSAGTIANMRRQDEWQTPERIKGYYETRGATSDPTPQYYEAKQRAEQWLVDHALYGEEAHHAA